MVGICGLKTNKPVTLKLYADIHTNVSWYCTYITESDKADERQLIDQKFSH